MGVSRPGLRNYPMTATKVTNICQGQRGIFRQGDDNATMIEAGQSLVLDLSDSDLADAKATDWFEFGEPDAADDAKPLARMNKTELLAIAAEEGVEVEESATNKEIVAAIEQARGE